MIEFVGIEGSIFTVVLVEESSLNDVGELWSVRGLLHVLAMDMFLCTVVHRWLGVWMGWSGVGV